MSLKHLECFAAMDWGYNAPGCVLWFACLLDGHIHCLKEWKFQRLTVHDVGMEVIKTTKSLQLGRMRYLVADPACWQHHGQGQGESIAETLQRLKLPMRKGDNNRHLGWQRLHELFREAPDGRPWLTIDPSCTYLRRTIPAAMSDKGDADDVDTTGDDHGLDTLRYAAMSRPSPTRLLSQQTDRPGTAGALLTTALLSAEGLYVSA
jgi:hypothetical protein